MVSVIKERIQEENFSMSLSAEQIADNYTSAKANKVDLHKCRLRVQVYELFQGSNKPMNLVGSDISNDIIDDRDINVGSFDLIAMSEPNGCCTMGKSL